MHANMTILLFPTILIPPALQLLSQEYPATYKFEIEREIEKIPQGQVCTDRYFWKTFRVQTLTVCSQSLSSVY